MSAASVTASPPDETTERKPTRGPIPRSASAIDPDCETTETRPGRKVSGTVPIQSEPSSGAATPMQFGPSSRASSARARSAIRAATSGPAAPASFPRPGRKKARTPGCERLLEGLLDAFVPDEEGGELRLLRKVGDAGETAEGRAPRPSSDALPRRGFPTARSPRRSARAAAKHPRRQRTAGRGGVGRGCDRPSRAHTILSTREATCTRSRSRSAGATRTPTAT